MSRLRSWHAILHGVITEKQTRQLWCRTWSNSLYSACMRSGIPSRSVRCRKVETQKGSVEPDRAEVGGFPSPDSGLKGVCVLPRGPLKPIITVFCQKLKANQGGVEGEGSTCPSVSHSGLSPQVEVTLLWRGVFAQTSCGAERDTSRVSAVIFTKDDNTMLTSSVLVFLWKGVRVFVLAEDRVHEDEKENRVKRSGVHKVGTEQVVLLCLCFCLP